MEFVIYRNNLNLNRSKPCREFTRVFFDKPCKSQTFREPYFKVEGKALVMVAEGFNLSADVSSPTSTPLIIIS